MRCCVMTFQCIILVMSIYGVRTCTAWRNLCIHFSRQVRWRHQGWLDRSKWIEWRQSKLCPVRTRRILTTLPQSLYLYSVPLCQWRLCTCDLPYLAGLIEPTSDSSYKDRQRLFWTLAARASQPVGLRLQSRKDERGVSEREEVIERDKTFTF